jgi:Domain of unknown function (DUF4389)
MYADFATDGPATATERPELAPVLVAFAGPAPQSRLTVLVRIFMVIPELIVLWLLGIAAMVVVIIGWFGALFTGRLPVFAADFLTGYLRWLTRVYAYLFLLTDEYPPFTLDDADYPVRVAVMPGRLNRLAVLFRFFLLIPCWIVQAIVAYGAFTIVQFASWLIVLISGQMPEALHQALAAALRYQIRTLAFALMLTSAYPAGLFGDPESGAQPGYGAGDASWRLIMSGAARKLMVGFLVLGVLVSVGGGAIDAVVIGNGGNAALAATAASQVQADAIPVSTAVNNYSANVKACNGRLACVTKLDRQVAATLNTFAGQLETIPMPSQATAANTALTTAVSRTAAIYARLGAATSPTQFINTARAVDLTQALNQVNQDYTTLGTALGA